MSPHRHLLLLVSVLSSGVCHLRAQETATDSAARPALDLSGTWRVSRPVAPGFTPITLVQAGTRLEADIVQHVRCAGRDVTMRVTLMGSVQGRHVTLRATSGQLQGDFQNHRCNNAVFVGTTDFRGEVSPDGRKIKGPYDN